MTPIITGGSSAVVGAEELTLDGLELHTSPFRVLHDGFDHKPSKKLLELLRGPDSHGAKLLRVPKHETSEVVLKLRVEPQADMDTALNRIGQVVDKLQEAERQSAGGRGRGLALTWSPAGSTFNGTFYVLAGEVEVPKDFQYLHREPIFTITLTCDPFIYGAEVTSSTTTSSLPLLTATFEDIPGDVEAEARFIVTDGATQNRDYVAAGVESFYYDAATSLLFSTSGMVYSPTFAATTNTRAGSYSGSILRATLSTTPVAVCGSGELTHKGGFRNYFRLYPSSDDISVRLAWRQGRDQWTTEPWTTLPTNAKWCEVDLGQTKIRPALLGTQSWQWRLEAKTTVAGDTLDVDYHAMVPTEYYGKARRTITYEVPKTFTAWDGFDQAAGAATGKTLPSVQTWQGAGDANDFNVDATLHALTRAPGAADSALTNGRFLTAGTTDYAALGVQVAGSFISAPASQAAFGVLARYVNTTNWVALLIFATDPPNSAYRVELWKYKASVLTFPSGVDVTVGSLIGAVVRLSIDAGGRWLASYSPATANVDSPHTLLGQGVDSDFATGGVLEDGRVGVYHATMETTPVQANVDSFSAWTPEGDAVCFSGQSLEFRSYGDDPVLREDSTGTYWGRPPESRGGRMWLPCAGTQDRTSRVAVLARRNDIESLPSENIADSTSVAVSYRSRWVAVPRQA